MAGQSLVVWYNTRCPVCDAGIDRQRNKLLQVVRAGHISFKDINEQPDALASYGASLDDVRRRLHATDDTGRLIVGADVAIATWRITPGEGWLASLTPREERVLRMRFGIGMNTDHTLEEVGQQFSVTRERIRQIEAKALRKLKHPSRSRKLRSFLDN